MQNTTQQSAQMAAETDAGKKTSFNRVKQKIEILAEKGYTTSVLPGGELDFSKKNMPRILQILKEAGRTSLSAGRIFEGHINALHLIHLFGREDQKVRWFAEAKQGFLFGVWNTQEAGGVDIKNQKDNSFLLTGKKTFASGAGLIQRAIVTGNLQPGWQMCVVETDRLADEAIDYASWQPMGMQDSLSYTVDFSGYEGMLDDQLGNADDYYKRPYFGAGAIRFCAVQLGGAEALFNHTLHYLKVLKRTDDPFQSSRIAAMATALATGDLWLREAGKHWDDWCDDESKSSQLTAFANMMRITVERICLDVIDACSKCVGARGLQSPHPIEQIVKDLQFYLRQPAPDAAMMDVAKYVIQSDNTIETMWDDNQ